MKLPEKGDLYEKRGIQYLCIGYDINKIINTVKEFESNFTVEHFINSYKGYFSLKTYIDILVEDSCILYVANKDKAALLSVKILDFKNSTFKRQLTTDEINLLLIKKKMMGTLEMDVNELLNLNTIEETKAFIDSYMGEDLFNKRKKEFIKEAKQSFAKIINSEDWKKDCSFKSYSEFFVRDNEYLSLYLKSISSYINGKLKFNVKKVKVTNKQACFDLYLSYLLYQHTRKRLVDTLDGFHTIRLEEGEETGYELYVLDEISE